VTEGAVGPARVLFEPGRVTVILVVHLVVVLLADTAPAVALLNVGRPVMECGTPVPVAAAEIVVFAGVWLDRDDALVPTAPTIEELERFTVTVSVQLVVLLADTASAVELLGFGDGRPVIWYGIPVPVAPAETVALTCL